MSEIPFSTLLFQVIHYQGLQRSIFTIPYGFQDASRRQRERIPGSIANYVTGVSECSQQRGNLKDNGYISSHVAVALILHDYHYDPAR
ncbi:hypothetical protein [Photorhabdus laumondii]|uniref:hypothetical protein n=1 Tax=Photorhabdus laumondii TaxID=2218628 RepID=UPI0033156FCD